MVITIRSKPYKLCIRDYNKAQTEQLDYFVHTHAILHVVAQEVLNIHKDHCCYVRTCQNLKTPQPNICQRL